MKAIVYTSNTGHTRAYAELLACKTGLPVYALEDAAKQLEKGASVIYLRLSAVIRQSAASSAVTEIISKKVLISLLMLK